MDLYKSNYMDVMSIQYDFMPTLHSARKMLWIQLRYPPPANFKNGINVKITSNDPNLKLPSQKFTVLDIVGTRVFLTIPNKFEENYAKLTKFVPKNQKDNDNKWHPQHHSDHWGYTLKDWVDAIYGSNRSRNWTYGSGVSIAYITW